MYAHQYVTFKIGTSFSKFVVFLPVRKLMCQLREFSCTDMTHCAPYGRFLKKRALETTKKRYKFPKCYAIFYEMDGQEGTYVNAVQIHCTQLAVLEETKMRMEIYSSVHLSCSF